MSANDTPIVTIWDAYFECSFEILVDALHQFLNRLRSKEIRPLAFGFTEIVEGHTSIDFQEQHLANGAFFVIQLVNYAHKTEQEVKRNVGAFLIYKSVIDKTQMVLQCSPETHTSQINHVVEIARHFTHEAQGHGVNVVTHSLPIDFTRDFTVSATIENLATFFADFNEQHKTFGYWIELPEQHPIKGTRNSFIILKTDGVNPFIFDATQSPLWRHEVGAIECLQIKDSTRLKAYASSIKNRDHFWSYINTLKNELQAYNLLINAKNDNPHKPIDIVTIDNCLSDFKLFIEAEKRMSFWKFDKATRKHMWVSQPERLAKDFLHTFLSGKFGNALTTFEEIKAGAGKIDIFVVTPTGERAVIELKICGGSGYTESYAQKGIIQLQHYMTNKSARNGFLVVFDSRKRDVAKGFEPKQVLSGMTIITKIIDMRPTVKEE